MPYTSNLRIGIIGGGFMGKAFYEGLKTNSDTWEVLVSDKNLSKKNIFKDDFTTSNQELVDSSEVILFATKPQQFDSCIEELKTDISQKLIISIMAGVKLKYLQTKTKSPKVARLMPNLGASVQSSLTGWIATDKVDTELLQSILKCVGKEIKLDLEEDLDKITALSGSGPAYFFYLTEIITQKALEYGFTFPEADKIAKQTIKASSLLLQKDSVSASELKDRVTSKGGTTEAALNFMYSQKLSQKINQAIDLAKKRSTELGKK